MCVCHSFDFFFLAPNQIPVAQASRNAADELQTTTQMLVQTTLGNP